MNYDVNTAPVRQTDPWSCSVASAAYMLHSIGIGQDYHDLETDQVFPVSWDWLLAHAGTQPIAIGSGSLYHWVAVRDVAGDTLLLANPAPNYRGLGDTMTEAQFHQWAPWACVWIAVEEAEDVGRIEELEQQVADDATLIGVLKAAGAAAQADIEKALIVPNLPKAAREALEHGALPAAATVARGGAPVGEG